MSRLSDGFVATLSVRAPAVGADRECAGAGALRSAVVLFALTMFAASGLLFLVQPMFARMVLPRLGGSPAVWNTCVLFFQIALLLGYLYAHFSTKWLGVRRQAQSHVVVLLLPLVILPLTAGSGTPAAGESPVWWLLRMMTVTVGLPFFVLSTTAPLLQRWFAALPVPSATDPYFLYAASNLGSMVALLGYPFLLEPALGIRTQALFWSGAYVIFVAAIAACAWLLVSRAPSGPPAAVALAPGRLEHGSASSVPMTQRVRWILLSFVPSSLMLGVTTHISTDLAAVPLLWVLPLALYLLTFVMAFSQRNGRAGAWAGVAAPPLALACLVTILLNAHAWWFIPLHLVAFFWCALVCHQELAKRRPDVAHLTEFYLWLSFGGMLGGVFNTLVAPVVFSTVLEYPLMLAVVSLLIPAGRLGATRNWRVVAAGYAVLLACVGLWTLGDSSAEAARAIFAAFLGVSMVLIMAQGIAAFRVLSALLIAMTVVAPAYGGAVLYRDRSFFGVMRVVEATDGSHRILRHGSTIHGWERLPADAGCEPASYYHPTGPVGDVMKVLGARLDDVALVGLGTGAMACYAAPAQRWSFYEIDPHIERIARNASLFTHLANAPVPVNVVIGDGRIKLQEAAGERYDLIVLDAFSSDAIPVHLLTREAIQVYLSRLKPDGVLAIHISNRYLRLEPVVAALARETGLHALAKFDDDISDEEASSGKNISDWMVLSRDPQVVQGLESVHGWREPAASSDRLWTDDYSNILSALR